MAEHKRGKFFCWFGLFFFFSVCSTKKLEAVATKRHKQALMLCASCLKLYCLFTALVLHLEQDRLKKWQLFCSMCVLALKDVYGESIFLAIKNFQEIKYLLVQVSLPYLVVIVLSNNPRFLKRPIYILSIFHVKISTMSLVLIWIVKRTSATLVRSLKVLAGGSWFSTVLFRQWSILHPVWVYTMWSEDNHH